MRISYTLSLLSAAVIYSVPLYAAPPAIDPTLQQQLEQQQQQQRQDQRYYQQRLQSEEKNKQDEVLKSQEPKANELADTGASFPLHNLRFTKSRFISEEKLKELAAPYVGRNVTFAELNELVAKINALYAQMGMVTALAVVPPQEIKEGVLEIRLVEGRLGKLRVKDNKIVDDAFYQERLNLTPHDVIDVPALRDDLQLLNHSNIAKVQADLRAGTEPGESDVFLHVMEPKRTLLQAFADNHGSKSTGLYRGGLLAQVYGLAGYDDQLTVQAVGTSQAGAFNGMLQYDLPVNKRGGRLTIGYQQGDIQIVKGPFIALDITGNSKISNLGYTQPVFQRNDFWIDAFANASYTETDSLVSGQSLSQFTVWRGDTGATFSQAGAGYSWQVRQALSFANVEDLFGKTENFTLLEGSALANKLFGEKQVAVFRGAWQYSFDKALSSALLFQEGGVSSVRGYQQAALSGSRGLYASAEYQYRFKHLTPFTFVDAGLISDPGATNKNISSVGLGLRWEYANFFVCDLAWGYTLKQVAPDQDKSMLHARLSYYWPSM